MQEETLPLSCPSFEHWEDDFFIESLAGSTSISSSENDYFEFFSQELSPPATVIPQENIIFCGKIIPYKDNVSISKKAEIKKQTSIKKKSGWGVFGWKFSLGSSRRQLQSKNGDNTTTLMHKDDQQRTSTKKYNIKKHGKGHGLPLKKMPMLTATASGKARWHMLLFGISRVSSGMELRDMKSRQSRHRQSPPPSPPMTLHSHRDEVSGGTNRASGLWGLIKVLSCGGNHDPTNMVIGSINRNQLE